jgi:hypothetical protein
VKIRFGAMRRRFFVYMLVAAAAVLAVAGLIHLGGAWLSPHGAQAVATAGQSSGAVAQMLDNAQHPQARRILQLIVIILAARALGTLAGRLGQPPVIGEIAAGVLLGPSLLGWMAPGPSGFLFSDASMPILQLLSQIGVLLFMLVIGVELEPSH